MSHPEDSVWAIHVAQAALRPGQSLAINKTFPAPSGIGDYVIGIHEGADVTVSGSIDSIVDGLILSAQATVALDARCTRCLTPITRDWNVSLQGFFPYESTGFSTDADGGKFRTEDEYEQIIEGEDESGDIYPLSQGCGFADIEALLRDNLVESLPSQMYCQASCKGLCPQCGISLNDNPNHHHGLGDIRFAQLESLKEQLEKQSTN